MVKTAGIITSSTIWLAGYRPLFGCLNDRRVFPLPTRHGLLVTMTIYPCRVPTVLLPPECAHGVELYAHSCTPLRFGTGIGEYRHWGVRPTGLATLPMDLAPFSQPTFDARAWVESILTPEKRDGTWGT